MSTLESSDSVLLQRGTELHSAPADMSTAQDTDLLLISRGGANYKCTVADWKASTSTTVTGYGGKGAKLVFPTPDFTDQQRNYYAEYRAGTGSTSITTGLSQYASGTSTTTQVSNGKGGLSLGSGLGAGIAVKGDNMLGASVIAAIVPGAENQVRIAFYSQATGTVSKNQTVTTGPCRSGTLAVPVRDGNYVLARLILDTTKYIKTYDMTTGDEVVNAVQPLVETASFGFKTGTTWFAIDGATPAVAYLSTDNGATWISQGTTSLVMENVSEALATEPAQNDGQALDGAPRINGGNNLFYCPAGDYYIALATDGIHTSPDLINWTIRVPFTGGASGAGNQAPDGTVCLFVNGMYFFFNDGKNPSAWSEPIIFPSTLEYPTTAPSYIPHKDAWEMGCALSIYITNINYDVVQSVEIGYLTLNPQ
jgi:hypothetical protein